MSAASKCTPAVTKVICKLIAQGCSIRGACLEAHITDRAYRKWIKQGAGDDAKQPYRDFYDNVKQAEAVALNAMAKKVFAGDKDWVAAMTFLERRDRDTWGKSERQEIEHKGEVLHVVNIVKYAGAKAQKPNDTK